MQDLWILSIKTSLPDTCSGCIDWKTTFTGYDGFEAAKKGLRNKLHDLVFSENKMFDENGKLKELEEYVSRCIDDEDDSEAPDYDDEWISVAMLKVICKTLYDIIAKQKADLSKFIPYYSDDMICVRTDKNLFAIEGDGDGPFNGCDPKIYTNMFDMEEEKDYYLYINDMFDDSDSASSELYIDLQKARME